MWNFSVYSDNIQNAIIEAVPGIVVGGQVVRDVVYADDDTPVNSSPYLTNLALEAIATQGAYNCFKFKPEKYRVIGADAKDLTEYKLGEDVIKRDKGGWFFFFLVITYDLLPSSMKDDFTVFFPLVNWKTKTHGKIPPKKENFISRYS